MQQVVCQFQGIDAVQVMAQTSAPLVLRWVPGPQHATRRGLTRGAIYRIHAGMGAEAGAIHSPQLNLHASASRVTNSTGVVSTRPTRR